MTDNTQKSNAFSKMRRISSHTAIITVLLVVSVSLNFLLAQKTKRLEKELGEDSEIIEKAESLSLNSLVPPLKVTDMNGQSVVISYQEIKKPVVLYVFSPSCNWCEQNVESIKFLAQARHEDYQFIGISLSSNQLKEYVERINLPFPVYHTPTLEVSKTYRFSRTPQTIVISPEGQVVKIWFGAYGNLYGKNTQSEIEDFFQVKLPGITQ